MRNRHDVTTRYNRMIQKEKQILDAYAENEMTDADNLFLCYAARRSEMPDDVYRAGVFFKNKEYLAKAGSLTLLYTVRESLFKELPEATPENIFDWQRGF